MPTAQQLETALRNADRAGDVEAAKILAGELAKMRAESYAPEAGGVGQRFVRGMGEAALGLGQIGVNVGANGSPSAEAVKSDFNQLVADYVAESEGMAPEGIDFARFAGNAAVTAPLGIGGAEAVAARTALPAVAKLAAGGAIAGGVGGAAMPVTEGDFGSTKAMQVAGGAAGGALLTPAASKLFTVLGRAGGTALRSVASKVQSGTPIAQIKIEITQALQQQGIDVARLGPAYLDDIANQVKRAKDAGGSLDPDILANQAAAKTLNIDLTRGQATQDASQFSKELFLRESPGGEDLASQYTRTLGQLNQGITEIQGKLPQPMLNVDAGQRAIDALKAADSPLKAKVDQLYEAAKNSAGRDTPVNGAAFSNKTIQQLEKDLALSDVPADLRTFMNTLATGQQLTIGRAEEVVQSINARLSNLPVRDPQRIALKTIKRNLDEAIDTTGDALGGATAQAFKQARTAAAVRFKKLEQVPALKDALDDNLAPDDFMRKVIYQSPRDELKKTRAFLRSNNKDAWNQLRAQVLEDIRLATTKDSTNAADFSQAAFNKQVGSLRKSGKLGLLFSESEIKQLNAIGRVGRLVQQGPPGVSRTGLSGNAKALGMLTQLVSRVMGPIGPLVSSAATKGGNALEATVSMQPAKVASPGGMPQLVPPNVQRALATGGSTLLVPASEQ